MPARSMQKPPPPPTGGGIPYISDGDACRKIQIKPLRGDPCGCGSSLNGPLREISVWSVSFLCGQCRFLYAQY